MKDRKLVLIVVAVFIAASLLSVFAFQGVKNKAISLEEQISTAQSEIMVQAKRRNDLIPNLVDCVKEYDNHEYQTLMDVVQSRGASSDNSAQEIRTMIQAVAESYPDLKSSENYKQLMNELATTENLISTHRTNFNSWVKSYYQYIRKFPNKQILGLLGYEVINYEYLDFNVSQDAPINLFE